MHTMNNNPKFTTDYTVIQAWISLYWLTKLLWDDRWKTIQNYFQFQNYTSLFVIYFYYIQTHSSTFFILKKLIWQFVYESIINPELWSLLECIFLNTTLFHLILVCTDSLDSNPHDGWWMRRRINSAIQEHLVSPTLIWRISVVSFNCCLDSPWLTKIWISVVCIEFLSNLHEDPCKQKFV